MATYGQLHGMIAPRQQRADQRARGSRNAFEGAAMGFDPMAYMRESAGSLFGGLSEQFANQQGQRAASLNRRGLFRSDIGGGAATRDFNDRLSQGLSGLAMQGAQMQGQNIDRLGGLYQTDQNQANRYFDAAYGARASQLEQEQADRASRRQGRGALLGAGLGVIGSAMGGPFGGMVGTGIGNWWNNR